MVECLEENGKYITFVTLGVGPRNKHRHSTVKVPKVIEMVISHRVEATTKINNNLGETNVECADVTPSIQQWLET